MKLLRRSYLFGLLSILSGCALQPPSFNMLNEGLIGTLGISGRNVFLNGRPVQNGMQVREGDIIRTGPNSSAVIAFTGGGFFQLDENTDPISILERLKSGICILVRMATGRGYTEPGRFCTKVQTPDALVKFNSHVNIWVTAEQTEITVLEGQIFLGYTQNIPIARSERATIFRRDLQLRIIPLSEQELARTVAWRTKFYFTGWCCFNGQVRSVTGPSPMEQANCPGQAFSFNQGLLEIQCRPYQPRLPWSFPSTWPYNGFPPTHPPTGTKPPPTGTKPPPTGTKPPPTPSGCKEGGGIVC